MGRFFLLAALLYGYGDPGFDGRRPEVLDTPVRMLHRAMDAVANDAQRHLITTDSLNALRTLPALGDKLRLLGRALAA
jgi:hypothetical protein